MGLDMYAQRLTISSDQPLPELEKAGSFENTEVPEDE
jgi:hypothetical protein